MADPVEAGSIGAGSIGVDSVKVALIAADGDSARLLREMLGNLDCPTVFDASAADFDPITLASSGANVVIVDLSPDAEIDSIYDLLDDSRYRVIFNEAAVTSRLSGWDHARWTRHLAAKILGMPAVIDPPRPNEPGPVAGTAPTSTRSLDAATRKIAGHDSRESGEDRVAVDLGIDDWLSEVMQAREPASSFVLAQPGLAVEAVNILEDVAPERALEPEIDAVSPATARNNELDALMASAIESLGNDDPAKPAAPKPAAEERFDWKLDDVIRDIDDWLPPSAPVAEIRTLATGSNARLWSPRTAEPVVPVSADNDDSATAETTASTKSAFDFELEPLTDADRSEQPARVATGPNSPLQAQATSPQPFAATPVKTDPIVASAGPAFSGVQTLELAPLDDAEPGPLFAARPLGKVQEMRIDVVAETDAPSRVIVLCASVGGPEAIRELLGALPSKYPALFLVVQQVGDEFLDLLSQQLRRATAMRVRSAELGDQLHDGDVIPVSPSQRLQVDRSGRVTAIERIDARNATPINQLLRDISDKFGADCTVIVLSGIASDVADGCRYLAGRGGHVYAQAASSCIASAMVEQVQQAGVVSFQGTPAELAAHLLANYS